MTAEQIQDEGGRGGIYAKDISLWGAVTSACGGLWALHLSWVCGQLATLRKLPLFAP